MGIFLSNNTYTNNDYQFQPLPQGAGALGSNGEVISKVSFDNSENSSASLNTVSGEVVEKNGDSIKLRLSNDVLLEAKLSGNVNVSVGQKLSFEVSKSANNQISLRPLYSNLSSESGIVAALKNAGLPINDLTISMTDKMMQEGMNVGKNALTNMFRDVSMHRNVSAETVVQINKLNMPVTDQNLTQFENYRNFEHRITSDIMSLADEITNVFDADFDLFGNENINSGKVTDNIEVFNQVLDIASDDSEGIAVGRNISESLNEINELLAQIRNLSDNDLTDTGVIQNNSSTTETVENFLENPADSETNVTSSDAFKTLKEVAVLLSDAVSPQAESKVEGDVISSDKQSDVSTLKNEIISILSKEGNEQLPEGLNNARDLISKLKDNVNKLVKSDDFKNLIKDSIKDKLALEPKEVAKDGKIEELYEKIRNTSNKVVDLMEAVGKQDSLGAKAAQNLNNNIDFMNRLNEFVNYVQLPLKMAGENAHGDLCVYTKKKNLNNNDGNYSALLHLDMEHLGPMDIYVTMRNHTKVNTNFYLESEELLDFIESHIDELTNRLKQKGYETGVIVSKKDSGNFPSPITDEFTKNEEGNVDGIVSRLSFDVRA